MRSLSRILVKETIGDIFTTGYCAATGGIEDFFFSVVESVVTKMIHLGVLDETLNQSFNR